MPLSYRQMVKPEDHYKKFPKLEEMINIPLFWVDVEIGHGMNQNTGEEFDTAKYVCLDENGKRIVYSTSANQPFAFAQHIKNMIDSGEGTTPINEWIVAKKVKAKTGNNLSTMVTWLEEELPPREESKHQADLPF